MKTSLSLLLSLSPLTRFFRRCLVVRVENCFGKSSSIIHFNVVNLRLGYLKFFYRINFIACSSFQSLLKTCSIIEFHARAAFWLAKSIFLYITIYMSAYNCIRFLKLLPSHGCILLHNLSHFGIHRLFQSQNIVIECYHTKVRPVIFSVIRSYLDTN